MTVFALAPCRLAYAEAPPAAPSSSGLQAAQAAGPAAPAASAQSAAPAATGAPSGSPATGARSASSDDPTTAKARALFTSGVQSARKGDWTRAEAAFAAAFELKRHWQIAANLGDSELALGRYRSAAEHLAFAVREAPPDLAEAQRKQQEEHWAQAKAQVGSLRVASVDGQPFDLVVDGERIDPAQARGEIYLDPGTHRVEARGKHDMIAIQQVRAEAGTLTTLRLRLAPPGAPIAAEPPSTQHQEGRAAGSAALVSSPSRGSLDASDERANGPARRPTWPLLAGAAVTAVAAAAGTGLLLAAHDRRSATEPYATLPDASCAVAGAGAATVAGDPCGRLYDDLAAHDRYTTLGTAALAVAGTAALATLIYWLTADPSPSPSTAIGALAPHGGSAASASRLGFAAVF